MTSAEDDFFQFQTQQLEAAIRKLGSDTEVVVKLKACLALHCSHE